jgi:hypothetical protein
MVKRIASVFNSVNRMLREAGLQYVPTIATAHKTKDVTDTVFAALNCLSCRLALVSILVSSARGSNPYSFMLWLRMKLRSFVLRHSRNGETPMEAEAPLPGLSH